MELRDQAQRARERFWRHFARQPVWVAAAPGRINLLGEHVDYNDGLVAPMAIDRYTVIAAAPSTATERILIHSCAQQETVEFDVNDLCRASDSNWVNYAQGVVAGFAPHVDRVPSLEMLIDSEVPMGAGLSSSAALEVAMCTVLEAVTNCQLEPLKKVLLCQQAEHEFAGVPCGIMDQFAAVYCCSDGPILLDCRDLSFRHVPLSNESTAILVINSNVKHDLATSQYSVRRQQCQQAALAAGVKSLRDVSFTQLPELQARLDKTLFARIRHVVNEIDRTKEFARVAEEGDWRRAGELFWASHDSLRDDYQVSCRELDVLVDCAREARPASGIYGSRMTGGGFGGCTVSLVAADKAKDALREITTRYQQRTGITASGFVTRPSRSAHMV